MAVYIGYEVVEGVAFLTVANPPLNALSKPVRVGLMRGLTRAASDDGVQEIVILGAGTTFPAGAELAEFDTSEVPSSPHLRDLGTHIEALSKPVVAVLHGTVFGGGCELALSAHYRLALRGTRISLPELKLGLVPGAGATQRLPRLIGAKAALDMLLGCQVLSVDTLPGQGLVHGTCEGDMKQAALQFCQKLRSGTAPPMPVSERRDGFQDMAAYSAAIKTRRNALKPEDGAAARIIDLVEAAPMVPFEIGLVMEEDAHNESLASDAAQALRHSFLAEYRARQNERQMPLQLTMETVAILGSGPLAMQIAVSALNAGMAVHWGARDARSLVEGRAQIEAVFQKGVESGGLSGEASALRLGRLKTGENAAMRIGSDLILHAAPRQGDAMSAEGIVQAVAFPAPVEELGLRFAPPVFASKLVEIVCGANCQDHQIATAQALAKRLGKVGIVVRSSGDSIAGKMLAALHRAADGVVDLGASPYAIDAALVEWGWNKPPFQSRDTLGLDVFENAPRGKGALNWSAHLAEVGRAGRACGAGFYDWTQDGPRPSEAVPRLINGSRPPKELSAELICSLIIGALANEGLRLLHSDMAQRAADIDLVTVHSLDFPKGNGGIMNAVKQTGMLRIFNALDRFSHPDSGFWQPLQMWHELIKNGKTFDER
ncbi:MAG: enoyl-CoA hydratase-related protein [Pelagimonas sp.]|uniref:enoyl-CoA hydratase-related protein n=1 Tax=Pelagimonas sp. TaxID=2073170 RepID=UPI003D6B61FA